MSRRTRSVEWIEGRIMAVLFKYCQGEYYPYPVFFSTFFQIQIRGHIRQDHFSYAFFYLIQAGLIFSVFF